MYNSPHPVRGSQHPAPIGPTHPVNATAIQPSSSNPSTRDIFCWSYSNESVGRETAGCKPHPDNESKRRADRSAAVATVIVNPIGKVD